MASQTLAAGQLTPQKPSGVDQMRGSVRFPLRLPVKIHTDRDVFSTTTEDISSTGVQFSGIVALVPGTEVRWEICLPAAIMGSSGDVKVLCTGRVMWSRSAPPEERCGVVIDSYLLKENEG